LPFLNEKEFSIEKKEFLEREGVGLKRNFLKGKKIFAPCLIIKRYTFEKSFNFIEAQGFQLDSFFTE